MLYLITPTQDRLLSFNFCIEFMQRQSYTDDVTWIICDSGKVHVTTPTIKNWTIIHKKFDYINTNTQKRNILSALEECDFNDKTLIIEDDDFYHENWLKIISDALDKSELAGETRAKYYHLKTHTFQEHKNHRHASLCATGIKGKNAYEKLISVCNTDVRFIDLDLWNQFKGPKKLLSGTSLVIGMKGLYGRSGLGEGHLRLRHRDTNDFAQLRRWIGNEWTDKYIQNFIRY